MDPQVFRVFRVYASGSYIRLDDHGRKANIIRTHVPLLVLADSIAGAEANVKEVIRRGYSTKVNDHECTLEELYGHPLDTKEIEGMFIIDAGVFKIVKEALIIDDPDVFRGTREV